MVCQSSVYSALTLWRKTEDRNKKPAQVTLQLLIVRAFSPHLDIHAHTHGAKPCSKNFALYTENRPLGLEDVFGPLWTYKCIVATHKVLGMTPLQASSCHFRVLLFCHARRGGTPSRRNPRPNTQEKISCSATSFFRSGAEVANCRVWVFSLPRGGGWGRTRWRRKHGISTRA